MAEDQLKEPKNCSFTTHYAVSSQCNAPTYILRAFLHLGIKHIIDDARYSETSPDHSFRV